MRVIQHKQWSIAYFNHMAAIWDITIRHNFKGNNTNWVTNNNNSLLKALLNMNNKDWRIIQIRETMHRRDWKILTLEEEEYRTVSQSVIQQCLDRLKTQFMPNSTAPQQPNNTCTHPTDTQQIDRISANSTTKPNIDDYIQLSNTSKETKELKYLDNENNKTQMIKELTLTLNQEIILPPNWITGPTMMAISDLTNNNPSRTMERNNNNNPCTHHTSSPLFLNSTLHTALECDHTSNSDNRNQLKEYLKKAGLEHETLTNCMKNIKGQQAILKQIKNVALKY